MEPTTEAIQQFKQLWDSLIPTRNIRDPQAEVSLSAALPAPLPRSLSLVPVETLETLETLEAMNAARRAILLLRGTPHVGS
jgi:hypothetical protein